MTQISLPIRLNQKESLIPEVEGFNPVRLALWGQNVISCGFRKAALCW